MTVESRCCFRAAGAVAPGRGALVTAPVVPAATSSPRLRPARPQHPQPSRSRPLAAAAAQGDASASADNSSRVPPPPPPGAEAERGFGPASSPGADMGAGSEGAGPGSAAVGGGAGGSGSGTAAARESRVGGEADIANSLRDSVHPVPSGMPVTVLPPTREGVAAPTDPPTVPSPMSGDAASYARRAAALNKDASSACGGGSNLGVDMSSASLAERASFGAGSTPAAGGGGGGGSGGGDAPGRAPGRDT
ncbi:hypothetical protein HXX76_001409 [Chlamydomonas incerta]|uniref:Uncharacterized protein n=1 Tax=Chlamydomonas incerta TaxID=51695 RepID=A0A836B148_CHLIN|nr:hypothetical protein HXX76_001409 [Chlamydomonas incerta]|eukprot:KAG2444665.1 hypothetical protein HXX76_001409 [Chlamydomonas incerta]